MHDYEKVSTTETTEDDILQELESLMRLEFFTSAPASPTPFAYRPLPNQNSIRILLLWPGTGNTRLCGSLKHVELEDGQEYEALSYVWGSPNKWFSMTLDGRMTPITESLYRALLRLRHPSSTRTIWIDALCINQDDSKEKSSQVSIMSKIYSNASRVICWLGEDSSGDGKATFQLLQNLGNTDFSDLSGGKVDDSYMRSKNLPGKGDPVWSASLRFFQRPWFNRAWVIQEFVLGRTVDMVCGGTQTSWRTLIAGIESYQAYVLWDWGTSGAAPAKQSLAVNESLGSLRAMAGLKIHQNAGDTFTHHIRYAITKDPVKLKEENDGMRFKLPSVSSITSSHRNLFKGMSQVFNPNDTVADIFNDVMREYMSSTTSGEAYSPPLIALCDLMTFIPASKSTDPRDRFFSLLNLSAQKDNPSLQPDYSEPVESTYLRFGRHFLLHPNDMERTRRTPTLDLLIFAGSANRTSSNLDLPSWIAEVPTSPASVGGSLLTGQTNLFWKAGGETLQKCRETGDVRTIFAAGGKVDRIAGVFPQPYYEPGKVTEETVRSFEGFFPRMDELIVRGRGGKPYPRLKEGETHEEVLWRTLIANVDDRTLVAEEGFRESYFTSRFMFQTMALQERVSLAVFKKSLYEDKFASNGWGIKWQRHADKYSVCETEGGLVGLVPNASRVGDAVCVFLGESMPIVVRAVEGDEAKHELIGACYVHGIMQGEAMESEDWREEDFCLV